MIYHRDLKRNIRNEVSLKGSRKESRSWLPHFLAAAAGVSLLGVVLAATQDTAPRQRLDVSVAQELKTVASAPVAAQPTQADNWVDYTIQPGDSASVIFDKYQIHHALLELNEIPLAKKVLANIHPGKTLSMKLGWNGLQELKYPLSETRHLTITRAGDHFSAKTIEKPVEVRRLSASGVIDSSLFLAGKRAGISDSLIMQLVDIFAYDIDFALDIRQGDRFDIIYDERYADGKPLKKSGPILAARFTNRNKTYTAFRFTDKNGKTGYYDAKGRSNRKAFIRTPVKFSRISSFFNPKRKHPILHTIRAHKGVDYAAPIGTPVKTTANGTVRFVGRKGGYGNVVVIKHFGGYSTLYAHLSKFKKGLKRGKRVKQGDVIAYVGKTGRATGPHLHYEFRVNGKHKDPLKVRLPNAPSLAGGDLSAFKAQTQPLLVQLKTLSSSQLATIE